MGSFLSRGHFKITFLCSIGRAIPSSRTAAAGQSRGASVKDGPRPPRSDAQASLTDASTAAVSAQQASVGSVGITCHDPGRFPCAQADAACKLVSGEPGVPYHDASIARPLGSLGGRDQSCGRHLAAIVRDGNPSTQVRDRQEGGGSAVGQEIYLTQDAEISKLLALLRERNGAWNEMRLTGFGPP
jgi:hypothetical protein